MRPEIKWTSKRAWQTSALLAAALALAGCNDSSSNSSSNTVVGPVPVEVKMIAINDLHGNLKVPSGGVPDVDPANPARTVTVPAGGVEFLSTHIANIRAKNPSNSVVVAAGDLIGATPLLSALFNDEPTIEALNTLGLDFSAVGNHEFDKGTAELLRMQNGGCHPTDGCRSGVTFTGAKFKYLAANVIDTKTGKPLLPAYQIKYFNGVPVAFIGMTLKGTPSIVTPSGVAGMEFRDEAETVNALVPQIQAEGVKSIVLLIHEGASQTGLYNECKGASGAIMNIAKKLDPAVAIIVSGHTHQAYNCEVDGRLITSARQYGQVVTEIDFTADPNAGITRRVATNRIVTGDVAKDAKQTAIIDRVAALVSPLENRIVAKITAPLTRTANAAGESVLGDIIADAQLDATADAKFGGAQIAFMNPGGIRQDFAAGDVTYGQIFTVQPFGNSLVTLTITGAQLKTVLEQQWLNQASPRIMQVSNGFTYTWDNTKPNGSKVDAASMKLNGVVINPTAKYRVTVNSFMATGGDGYLVFNDGTERLGGAVDVDALEAYFKKRTPIGATPRDRIKRVDDGKPVL